MVFVISIFSLIILLFFSITKNRNTIGLYLFIFLFFPNEISITNFFDITIHKAAYLIFLIYILQIIRFKKLNPVNLGLIFLSLSLIVPFYNKIDNEGNIYYNFLFYFIPNLILPCFLFFYGINSGKDLKVIFFWLIILIYTWFIYGSYEFFTSSNPFIDSLIKEFPLKTISVSKGYIYTDSTRFGTISRLQCTVWHPISFGIRVNIILSILFFFKINYSKFYKKTIINNYLFFYLPIIMIILLSIATNSRSIWLDTIIVLLFYWKNLLNRYYFKNIIILFLSFIIFINYFEIKDFILENILSNVEGSSFEMRINQFLVVIDMLKNNFIFGLGIGFIGNYLKINSLNTEVYGFESVLFTTIIETGFIGLFALIFYLLLIRKSIINHTIYNKSIDILFTPFIITIILTGEMQNLSLFSLLMTIFYSINFSKKDIKFKMT